MPDIILLPNSARYLDSYTTYGAAMQQPGHDGCRLMPFYFTWSNTSAAAPGFLIAIPDQPNMIKSIATMFVDNSRCSSGVYIIFPDSGFRIAVPPYRRGYYPAITEATTFYCGIINPAGANAADKTTVAAMNFLVPPQEHEALILPQSWSITFNPAGAVGSTLINQLPAGSAFGGNYRMRRIALQLAGMTATAAGFIGQWRVFADGVRILIANLSLAANEFVDAGTLLERDGMMQSARAFTYDWNISAGALTGAALACIDAETDAADVI